MNPNLSADQFNDGWGTLPANYKPESGKARKAREDDEYRVARHAETQKAERETLGYSTEGRAYRQSNPGLNYGSVLRHRAAAAAY